MDPNALSSLDPKLRETYEKVMGTGTAPLADTPANPPAVPADQASADPAPQAPAADAAPAGAAPTSAPAPEISSAPVAENAQAADQGPKVVTISQAAPAAPAPELQITQPHGHMGLMKVFYILGGVVFFVIYIFFWMRIFNLSLPF